MTLKIGSERRSRLLRMRDGLGRHVGHTELSAEVLGEQFDGDFVGAGILLRQVLHGFNQQALAFEIAWVALPAARAPLRTRHSWNDENFSHQQLRGQSAQYNPASTLVPDYC